MDQTTIDGIQQAWIVRIARSRRCLHVGCGMKPIRGAYNIDANPERDAWSDLRLDAHDLSVFHDSWFDCVVSSHVMPHLHSPVIAMREMGRVLRPGGVMAHVIPDARYAPQRIEPLRPFADQPWHWTPDDFAKVMDAVADLFGVIELAKFEEFDWSFKVMAIRRYPK